MQLTINKKKNGFYTKRNAEKIKKQLEIILKNDSLVKELNANAACKIDRRMKYQQIFTNDKKHKYYNILKHISPQYFIGQDGTIISVKNTNIIILSRGYRQPNQHGITRDRYTIVTDYIEHYTEINDLGKKIKKQRPYILAIESYMLTALVFSANCSDRCQQLILSEGIKALDTNYMLKKYDFAIVAHHNKIDFKDCLTYKQANNPENILIVTDKAHNALLRGKNKELQDFNAVSGEFVNPYAILDNTLYLNISKAKNLEDKEILNTDEVLKKLVPDNYQCIDIKTKQKLTVKINKNPSAFIVPEDFEKLQEILTNHNEKNISYQVTIEYFKCQQLAYIIREYYLLTDNDSNEKIDLYILSLI